MLAADAIVLQPQKTATFGSRVSGFILAMARPTKNAITTYRVARFFLFPFGSLKEISGHVHSSKCLPRLERKGNYRWIGSATAKL